MRAYNTSNWAIQATDQNTIIAEEAKAFQPEDVKTMTDFTLAACVRCYFNTS